LAGPVGGFLSHAADRIRASGAQYRTQARVVREMAPVRNDSMLQRWADNIRKEGMKQANA
jgi:hypothetical protein